MEGNFTLNHERPHSGSWEVWEAKRKISEVNMITTLVGNAILELMLPEALLLICSITPADSIFTHPSWQGVLDSGCLQVWFGFIRARKLNWLLSESFQSFLGADLQILLRSSGCVWVQHGPAGQQSETQGSNERKDTRTQRLPDARVLFLLH